MDMKNKIEYIKQCVGRNNVHAFYVWGEWRKIRDEVFRLDKKECQACKAKGIYSRATLVHHVKHLRDFPELGLAIFEKDIDGNEHRQLISLCDECHEKKHPERLRQYQKKRFTTVEKWE